jgi:hypothetical protein
MWRKSAEPAADLLHMRLRETNTRTPDAACAPRHPGGPLEAAEQAALV